MGPGIWRRRRKFVETNLSRWTLGGRGSRRGGLSAKKLQFSLEPRWRKSFEPGRESDIKSFTDSQEIYNNL